jgi:hypothetical protein
MKGGKSMTPIFISKKSDIGFKGTVSPKKISKLKIIGANIPVDCTSSCISLTPILKILLNAKLIK